MSQISTYSEFILNETLLTHDIDLTIRNVNLELSKLNYNFNITKVNNTINIELLNYCNIFGVGSHIDTLNSLLIDRHGWFPSHMIITNFSSNTKLFPYDENKLKNIDDIQYYESVEIIYESKYDIEINIPDKLYHISIQEFEDNIIKRGIICKSKLKMSNHLDRIYVCSDVQKCYGLIPNMKFIYTNKKLNNKLNKINSKWVLYEIDSTNLDIKLYKDPNYINGYYITDNIPPNLITIIDKEK